MHHDDQGDDALMHEGEEVISANSTWELNVRDRGTPEKAQDIHKYILCSFWYSGEFPRFVLVANIQFLVAVWRDTRY